jgi:DNA repair exonuclease SbcCD ATPase subunit
MHPHKLYIENFCGHSQSEIDFTTFSTAIIVGKIKGNARFSNGVGKTTIFSAIKYVLFNEVDFSTLEKVIRHGCEFCRVSLDFEVNGTTYKVVRSKSKKAGSELRLFRYNKDQLDDLTQRKASDTEKELAKLIKLNYKTFCNSSLFSQTEVLHGLGAMTPGVRKIALKDALQLGVYSNLEKLTKKKITEISKDIDKEKIILSTLGDPEKDINNIETDIILLKRKISELSLQIDQSKLKNDNIYKTYADKTNEYKLLEQQSVGATEKQKIIQSELTKIKSSIFEFSSKLNKLNASNKASISNLEFLTKQLNNLSLPDKTIKLELDNELSLVATAIIELKATHKNIIMKIDELSIPLPDDPVCKHCRQTLNEEHKKTCKIAIEKDIEQAKDKLLTVEGDIRTLLDRSKNIKIKITKLEQNNAEYISTNQALATTNKELTENKSLITEYNTLHGDEQSKLTTKLKELDELKQLSSSKSIAINNKLKQDIDTLKKQLVSIKEEIDISNNNLTQFSNEKAVLEHKKDDRLKDVEKILTIRQRIIELQEQYYIHNEVANAFSSSGIPALITHTILDDFQIETNALLMQLKPGLQAQFSIIKDRSDGDKEDTLDINYILNGHDLEFNQLSGAQKLIASLCLKLGLASVIKKRLGVDLKPLLIDEIDQSLDDGGLEAFEDAIKQLQKEFKILIITHNKELKDSFNTAIVVDQDADFVSKASVCNDW